jgi:hypothetical protein
MGMGRLPPAGTAQAGLFNGHVTTLDDLSGKIFASVPEVADITGRDERTIRKCVESGSIPGQKIGANWSIPTSWLREQAGIAETAAVPFNSAALAAEIAARVTAALAGEVVARLVAREAGVSDGAETA